MNHLAPYFPSPPPPRPPLCELMFPLPQAPSLPHPVPPPHRGGLFLLHRMSGVLVVVMLAWFLAIYTTTSLKVWGMRCRELSVRMRGEVKVWG